MAMREEKKEIVSKIVRVDYNPFIKKTTMEFEGIKKEGISKTLGILELNKEQIFQKWINQFIETLLLEINTDKVVFYFSGRNTDYLDLSDVLLSRGEKGYTLNHTVKYENKDIMKNIIQKIEGFKEVVEKNSLKSELSNYSKLFKGEVKIVVMATMSSGKSTFLNAIIGSDILPSENSACTSKIFEIIHKKDLKKGEFEVRLIKDGKPLFDWRKVTKENLEKLNQSNENIKIEIAGNIPFLSNENYSIRLIDTPGPNNSNDREHRKTSFDFIKNEKDCLILYVLDSTSVTTTDSSTYLEEISKTLEEEENKGATRFIVKSYDMQKVA